MNTTTPIPDRLALLDTLALKSGSHPSFEAGACAMEAVAWLAGEPHSDAPACACPVVARAVIGLNDRIRDEAVRTELLRPLLPRLVGSRAAWGVMVKRAFVAADFAVRVFAPLALEARGHKDHAAALRACSPIADRVSAEAGRVAARSAASASAADAAAAAAYASASAAAASAAAADAAYASASAAAAAAAASAAYASADAADRISVYREGVRMVEAMLAVTS